MIAKTSMLLTYKCTCHTPVSQCILSHPQRLKGFYLGGENLLNDISAAAGLQY